MRKLGERLVQPYQEHSAREGKPVARHEYGASLVEYALLIMLVSLAAFLAVVQFGTSVRGSYEDSTQRINDALGN